jgi:hypothetical protein
MISEVFRKYKDGGDKDSKKERDRQSTVFTSFET